VITYFLTEGPPDHHKPGLGQVSIAAKLWAEYENKLQLLCQNNANAVNIVIQVILWYSIAPLAGPLSKTGVIFAAGLDFIMTHHSKA
jgi:hypothetical protein